MKVFKRKEIKMVRLRFATYYENHPETYDISKILATRNDKINAQLDLKKAPLTDRVSEKKSQEDEYTYLKQSVEMKIELALMYLKRSNAHLQYL